MSATPPPPPGNTPPPPPGGGAAGAAASTRPNAEFGERAIAFLIDAAILFGLYIAVFIVALILGAVSDILGAIVGFLGYLVILVASVAMQIMGEGGPLGQTPGKHMRGIQVVKDDGAMLSMGEAAIRWVGRILDTIVCGLPIGYLWPLFDDEDRCWHDIVASTRVKQGGPKGSIQDWVAKFRA